MFDIRCQYCNQIIDAGKMYWHSKKCPDKAEYLAKWTQNKTKSSLV